MESYTSQAQMEEFIYNFNWLADIIAGFSGV